MHPLVHVNPRTQRKSLYLASHATRVIEMLVPEAAPAARPERARDSAPIRVQPQWRERDLVIWDNQASMHRSTPFDDAHHRRELRRITTIDVEVPAYA